MCKINRYIVLGFLAFVSFHTFSQSSSHYEKALQSYQQKEYNESYIHLKNALKENPDDLSAKILMGEMLLINGYFKEAVTELEEALNLGADPNLVIKSYGKVLILTQKFQDILLLEFDGLHDNSKFELNMLRATAYASLGDTVDAEKTYLLAHRLKPTNVRTLNSLVTLYLKKNDIKKSAFYINLSMQANAEHPSTWRLKGLLEKQQKNSQQALASFEKAYSLNPNDPFVLRAYADGLWETKQIEKAEKIIAVILAQTPDDPYAILLQSQILSVTDKSEQAQKLLSKLAQDLTLLEGQSFSSNLSLRFASGMTAYLTHNYELALSDIIYYVNNSAMEINTIGLLADTYLKLKKERSALKLLENNEELVTQNLNISLLLCDLYLKSNRAFKCEKLAEILKKKYPNKPKVDFVRAKTLIARDKIEQAINLLSAISDPTFYHQRELAIAHIHFQAGQYAKAHKIAKSLLEELPKDIDILNLNVALLIKSSQLLEAEKLVNTILDIQPNYGPARYNKANILAAKKQYQQALDIMIDLESKNQLQSGSYLLYADILNTLNHIDEAIAKLKFAAKLDQGSLHISEKLIELYIINEQYKDAIWEISTYSKNTFNDNKYALTRAELMHKVGQVAESKQLLAELFAKWAKKPDELIKLSQTQLRTKDFQAVEETLLSILSLQNNKNLQALLQLADLYSTTNQPKKVQSYLTIANKLYFNTPAVLVAQAKLHISNQKPAPASKLLWSVLAINDKYFPAYAQLYQLSKLGFESEKYEAHLEKRLLKEPNQHLLRNLLADSYLQNKRPDEAEKHYKQLIKIEGYKNIAAVLNNLAFITIEIDLKQALLLVEKGLVIAPKSASLVDTKGWILVKQGQHEAALTLLRQAYSLDSNDPSIRYHLAYTLHKMNRTDEAKKELKQAFALDIPFIESTDAKALLNSW